MERAHDGRTEPAKKSQRSTPTNKRSGHGRRLFHSSFRSSSGSRSGLYIICDWVGACRREGPATGCQHCLRCRVVCPRPGRYLEVVKLELELASELRALEIERGG